ncbi:MAG: AAA family ATPase [Myxococcales bacterium]|nr:AAA family ATPase [Myxococcales bacterium]
MKQLAIYGKGGIGKSTIAANLSAAWAERGLRVLQVGCDPKHDSTRLLLGGTSQRTVVELLRARSPWQLHSSEVVLPGYRGVHCVEAGGPEPGLGCAGRGIVAMANALEGIGLDRSAYDVVLYDVLGDVVCGGFAVPMRQGYADSVLIVSSGESMSLYAANNIARGLLRTGCKLRGIIGNARGVTKEEQLLQALAERLGTRLLTLLPRDELFRAAELERKTIIEHLPSSQLAGLFRKLAEEVGQEGAAALPSPLEDQELDQLIYEQAGGSRPSPRAGPAELSGAGGGTAAASAGAVGHSAPLERGDGRARYRLAAAPHDLRYASKAVRSRAPLHSCALAGAFSVTNHVLDAVTVMHSPSSCARISLSATFAAGEAASMRGLDPVPSHALPRLLSTELGESDLVSGCEGKLEASIRHVARSHAPSAIFVLSSCPSGIAGEDVGAVARRLGPAIPVIAVDTEGAMGGDFAQGAINAYRALADSVLPAPEVRREPELVNLVGEEPFGTGADEDHRQLERCVGVLGLRVNTRFVRRTSLRSIRELHRAPLNIRVSGSEPAKLAQRILEERAGARFADCPAPIGYESTLRCIQALSEATGRAADSAQLAMAEAEWSAGLDRLRPALAGTRVLLGVYTQESGWIAELVKSLGMRLMAAAVLDSCMNVDLGLEGVPRVPVRDAAELCEVVRELEPDLLLANYLVRDLPPKLRAAHVPLFPPLGFTGTLRVAERWARAAAHRPEGWRADRQLLSTGSEEVDP